MYTPVRDAMVSLGIIICVSLKKKDRDSKWLESNKNCGKIQKYDRA